MTMQNDISAMREELFKTLRGLGDKENPMDIDRAKAVSDVAQTIINSAKVEVDALRVIGGNGTGFIPAYTPKLLDGQKQAAAPGLTVHKCK